MNHDLRRFSIHLGGGDLQINDSGKNSLLTSKHTEETGIGKTNAGTPIPDWFSDILPHFIPISKLPVQPAPRIEMATQGKTPIDPWLSGSIDRLRFPLAFAVVFIHAAEMSIWLPGRVSSADSELRGSLPGFLIHLFSQVLARVAVPTFFLISGFLICADHPSGVTAWTAKIRTRVRTLLIPFLFWNSILLVVYTAGQAFGPTQRFFSGRFIPIDQAAAWDYLKALFGINQEPINAPLWFVRDLLILVLLAPGISPLVKTWPILTNGVLGLCWLGVLPLSLRVPAVSSEAIFFFALGISFGLYRPIPTPNWFKKIGWVPLLYALLATLEAYLQFVAGFPVSLFHKFNILVGVAAGFVVAARIPDASILGRRLKVLGAASFFVFAAHSPLLTALRKVIHFAVHPSGSWSQFAWLYCLAGVSTVLLCLVSYAVLKAIFPRFLSLIGGPPPNRAVNLKERGFVGSA